jgi:hypothetical protein
MPRYIMGEEKIIIRKYWDYRKTLNATTFEVVTSTALESEQYWKENFEAFIRRF